MKKIILAAALALSFTAPAFAEDMMKCDDATMKMMHDEMDKMGGSMAKQTDAMKKGMEMAKADMMKAEDAMKAGKMDDCTAALGMAHKDMMMK